MVSERRFFKEVFGSDTECPPFTDLAAGIERGDPGSAAHAAACPHCAAELKLYAEFMAVNPTVANADVRWVAKRLKNPARPRKARLASWIDSLLHPRNLVAGAAVLATLVVAIGIGLEQRGPGRVRPTQDSEERGQSVELVAPKGGIADLPVEWKWAAVPGASLYQVQLMEVDKNILWRVSTSSNAVSVPVEIQKLALPEKRLLWTVAALDGNGRVIATGTQSFRRQIR